MDQSGAETILARYGKRPESKYLERAPIDTEHFVSILDAGDMLLSDYNLVKSSCTSVQDLTISPLFLNNPASADVT